MKIRFYLIIFILSTAQITQTQYAYELVQDDPTINGCYYPVENFKSNLLPDEELQRSQRSFLKGLFGGKFGKKNNDCVECCQNPSYYAGNGNNYNNGYNSYNYRNNDYNSVPVPPPHHTGNKFDLKNAFKFLLPFQPADIWNELESFKSKGRNDNDYSYMPPQYEHRPSYNVRPTYSNEPVYEKKVYETNYDTEIDNKGEVYSEKEDTKDTEDNNASYEESSEEETTEYVKPIYQPVTPILTMPLYYYQPIPIPTMPVIQPVYCGTPSYAPPYGSNQVQTHSAYSSGQQYCEKNLDLDPIYQTCPELFSNRQPYQESNKIYNQNSNDVQYTRSIPTQSQLSHQAPSFTQLANTPEWGF